MKQTKDYTIPVIGLIIIAILVILIYERKLIFLFFSPCFSDIIAAINFKSPVINSSKGIATISNEYVCPSHRAMFYFHKLAACMEFV